MKMPKKDPNPNRLPYEPFILNDLNYYFCGRRLGECLDIFKDFIDNYGADALINIDKNDDSYIARSGIETEEEAKNRYQEELKSMNRWIAEEQAKVDKEIAVIEARIAKDNKALDNLKSGIARRVGHNG